MHFSSFTSFTAKGRPFEQAVNPRYMQAAPSGKTNTPTPQKTIHKSNQNN
jgi:hypothetical protein